MSENLPVPVLVRPLGWGEPSVSESGFVLPTGTVTLLLGDVEGSTRAWESDPKSTQTAIVELNELVDELVGRFDGVRPVEQGEGDSFVAAFARARDGVACAFALQQALVGRLLHVRLGIHTGDVTRRDEGNYVGPTIIRTARLRNLAHGGQTVVSQATCELVADALPDGVNLRDLGVHRLKDLARAERVYQLCHSDLRDEFPPLRSLDARPHNLPVQRTTFIGRDREMADLVDLIAGEPLVTLTGSGGCGKTRLALQVGAEMLDAFPDGVWFADLAAVTDAAAVPTTLTQMFSLREGPAMTATEALVAYLGERRVLVILDNCEHLLDAAASVAEALLRGCPGVVVLATSRQPLGLDGEVAWRVPSLPVPADDGPAGIKGISASAAVQLFADRAQRTRPGFVLSERNADAVAEVCRRLDGIPLAIELAAARARVFTPAQIAAGLSERFALLTGAARTALPRQQTLEASVDWSHNLLTDVERTVLRRLAAFAGSFTFDAAQEVCADDQVEVYQILDLLSLLVDKSLVVAEMDNGNDARYRLLETVRVYAMARLAGAGEETAARDRHRDHYLGLATEAEGHLEGPEQMEWGSRLAGEYPNIRAALEWCQQRGDATAMGAACVALASMWASRGPSNDGEVWLDASLARLDELGSPLDAKVLFGRAWLAGNSWDLLTMITRAQEGVERARAVGDDRLVIRFRILLGIPMAGGSLEALEELIDQARRGHDEWALAAGLMWLGTGYLGQDPQRARVALAESVKIGRACNRPMANVSIAALADAWVIEGDLRRARQILEDALPELAATNDRFATTGALAWLTHCLLEVGDVTRAHETVDRLEAVGREGGIRLWESLVPTFRAMLAVAEGLQERGVELAQEALEVAFIPFTKQIALATLTEAELGAGLHQRARAHAAELVEACRVAQSGYALSSALLFTAALARLDGDLRAAETTAHEALTAAHDTGARCRVIDALELLGRIATDLDSAEEASRLLGATEAAREVTGYGRVVFTGTTTTSSARTATGDPTSEAAVAQGRSLSLDQAVAYARRGRGERKRPSSGWASLTPMELQVVGLVREGKTNAEIGEQLFASPRTVQSHLSRIYTKLGVKSRTALAALPGQEPGRATSREGDD